MPGDKWIPVGFAKGGVIHPADENSVQDLQKALKKAGMETASDDGDEAALHLFFRMCFLIPALQDHHVECGDQLGLQFQSTGVVTGVSCSMSCSLGDYIIHLNDTHEWTREEIADWLDFYCEEEGVDLFIAPPEGEA